MNDGATANGRYFGITGKAPAEAEQRGYVFLPAAGSRVDGRWYDVTFFGGYWFSAPNATKPISLGFFDKDSCYALNNDIGSYGRSVRCVRNK